MSAENFLRKNMDSLKETNPSKAYSILKRMGAQPGDCEEAKTFTLPEHDDLSEGNFINIFFQQSHGKVCFNMVNEFHWAQH